MRRSMAGTVEIKKCGFNERPKLMAPGPESDAEATVDVLPELFRAFEGKNVRVTVELLDGQARK